MREPSKKKKHYKDDCPGCKVEQSKELNQGVSIKNLFIIWMVVLCSSKHYFSDFDKLILPILSFEILGFL
jgi:hypothetical protein